MKCLGTVYFVKITKKILFFDSACNTTGGGGGGVGVLLLHNDRSMSPNVFR